MAEILSAKCSHCKQLGIAQCDGCSTLLCSTHFREHRQHLDTKFAQLWHDRSNLPHHIVDNTSKIKQHQLKGLLDDINQWEEQALESIKRKADRVRSRIKELMALRGSNIKTDLDQISQELRKCKTDNNYFEKDIKNLNEKLNQIQIDLNVHKSHAKMILPPIKMILPTKYQINAKGQNAIGCKANMGPTFGLWDICVYSNSNENARSHILFPNDYIDSTGKGRLTFTGSHYFKSVEIEVYSLKQN
ncbi:unnamed protein product [Rotaria socialis]|uniref:B box-type domain-containing protein n=1 Tax=Rotaria socialis TaxID=392032 RepID=A0A820M6R4_9BILA|nr:unnamed protein product [Rotaria socialis]